MHPDACARDSPRAGRPHLRVRSVYIQAVQGGMSPLQAAAKMSLSGQEPDVATWISLAETLAPIFRSRSRSVSGMALDKRPRRMCAKAGKHSLSVPAPNRLDGHRSADRPGYISLTLFSASPLAQQNFS